MNLPHYAVTLSTGFKSDLNRTLILNQMNPLFYAVFYSLFLDPVSKVHVFYSAPCSHTHSMCSSLNMTDMLHNLIPYMTTGVHYDRSFVRWSSQDGSSTSIGTAVLSPDCIWCCRQEDIRHNSRMRSAQQVAPPSLVSMQWNVEVWGELHRLCRWVISKLQKSLPDHLFR